ncbi:MAG: hypothetical protein JXR51_07370 [Bacteroidales bacterium]|nr:hypothetical protein [Bacteroidales bacterium]MBN2756982.1 hypothetical protein [Bacteroidales bacterium]
MSDNLIKRENIKQVFLEIKPYFKDNLGLYTHQRISGDWHFHGLGFVNGDMTYVFGINIGFFKVSEKKHYSHVGMNILVRTNGVNRELRLKYRDFFRENLSNWITDDEMIYTSDRGGIGSEFPRYKELSEFKDEKEVITFLKKCIDDTKFIYSKIIENPENIFDGVLRAAPPWHETLLLLANEKTEVLNKK